MISNNMIYNLKGESLLHITANKKYV